MLPKSSYRKSQDLTFDTPDESCPPGRFQQLAIEARFLDAELVEAAGVGEIDVASMRPGRSSAGWSLNLSANSMGAIAKMPYSTPGIGAIRHSVSASAAIVFVTVQPFCSGRRLVSPARPGDTLQEFS